MQSVLFCFSKYKFFEKLFSKRYIGRGPISKHSTPRVSTISQTNNKHTTVVEARCRINGEKTAKCPKQTMRHTGVISKHKGFHHWFPSLWVYSSFKQIILGPNQIGENPLAGGSGHKDAGPQIQKKKRPYIRAKHRPLQHPRARSILSKLLRKSEPSRGFFHLCSEMMLVTSIQWSLQRMCVG
jgi:hypothetical protein